MTKLKFIAAALFWWGFWIANVFDLAVNMPVIAISIPGGPALIIDFTGILTVTFKLLLHPVG